MNHASSLRLAVVLCSVAAIACGQEQQAAPPPSSSASSPVAAPAAAPITPQFEVAEQPRPTKDITFQSALELAQNPTGAEPQLRKGIIAKSSEWPASLYVTFPTPRGTAACTAAIVGPQAVLTAAHCVPTAGKVTFTSNNRSFTLSCTQHPQYLANTDASADYALCKIDQSFGGPAGFKYETIGTSSMESMNNQRLILTGFGCVSDIVGAGPADGKYRIGFNTIDETSASADKRRGQRYYAGAEDNNLFTKDDPAMANLCPGDSGGPAFLATGGNDPIGNRLIVGVNSRVFYRDATRSTYGSSLVSSTGSSEFRTWAEAWAKNVGKTSVCGLLPASIPNCRS